MNTILLNQLETNFTSDFQQESEVWGKKVSFTRGLNYLILAQSGSGKSSLFSYILGERMDYNGGIYFDDDDIRSLKSNQWAVLRQHHLSAVFQGLRLFPELTAWENVQLKNKIGLQRSDMQLKQLFDEVGLAHKLNDYVGKLSFGQQQRIALIRSLCQRFNFLLLDEPFSHLDQENANVLCLLIKRELAVQGASLLISSLSDNELFTYQNKLHLLVT